MGLGWNIISLMLEIFCAGAGASGPGPWSTVTAPAPAPRAAGQEMEQKMKKKQIKGEKQQSRGGEIRARYAPNYFNCM